MGATVPATLEHTLCNALVDTGATRSCLSEEYYQKLLLPGLKPVHKLQVRTAPGDPTKKRLCVDYSHSLFTKGQQGAF